MEYRKIGTLNVSTTGLGCNNFGWRLDYDHTVAVVDAALEAGINFLDTADIYGPLQSEEYLGRALQGRRDRVVLATKFGMKVDDRRKGAKPDYARQACEDSLRRLRTDHIDLYQLHQPDPETPIADTLGALDELVRAGKVREIGCSNFSVEQLREAEAAAGTGARFVSVQNEFSLLHRDPERGVLAECERQGMAFLPFFPLAGGMLTGKYRLGQPLPENTRLAKGNARFLNDRNLGIAEELIGFAAFRGHSLLELAFSWLLSHPQVASVIAGATSPEQVHANVHATGWHLTHADLAEIDKLAPAESPAS
ncbi:MAG TPA: aldo/keto reductase [Thermoanaerobaculia bacterium]|jgi:aryl-alcohol dehydrogenase-like predicted oxidoreductase